MWGLLRPGPPAPTPTAPKSTTPENLADVVADFGTAFTPTGLEGPFTLDTLERFFGAAAKAAAGNRSRRSSSPVVRCSRR